MILYFVITLIATLIGSVAGMGGGVIIKPVLDLIGDYDIVTISMLSSLTVVSMALTATVKQMRNGFLVTKPMIAVTAGAVIGGTLGGVIFSIAKATNSVSGTDWWRSIRPMASVSVQPTGPPSCLCASAAT